MKKDAYLPPPTMVISHTSEVLRIEPMKLLGWTDNVSECALFTCTNGQLNRARIEVVKNYISTLRPSYFEKCKEL